MKIISTKVHGYMDYLMGLVLIVAPWPWLFGFAEGGAETWIPVLLGISTIVYSLFTDYELGASRSLSMKTHLGLDTASGIILAASPWLFGFADIVFWPHLILGLLELGAVAMTETTPSVEENDVQSPREYRTENTANTGRNSEVTPQSTKTNPQRTASNSMQNRKDDQIHKAGIHNREERAAEPRTGKDEIKPNNEQSSHSRINKPRPNRNERNRESAYQNRNENFKSAKTAKVENNLNSNKSGYQEKARAERSDLNSTNPNDNRTPKTQDPSNTNRDKDPNSTNEL